jgi:hypothetical protein
VTSLGSGASAMTSWTRSPARWLRSRICPAPARRWDRGADTPDSPNTLDRYNWYSNRSVPRLTVRRTPPTSTLGSIDND